MKYFYLFRSVKSLNSTNQRWSLLWWGVTSRYYCKGSQEKKVRNHWCTHTFLVDILISFLDRIIILRFCISDHLSLKKSHVFFYIVDYLLLVDSTCSDFTYNSVSKKKDNTAGGMLLTRDGLCLWCSEWSSEYYNSTGQRQQTVNTVSISTSSAFLQDLDFFTGFDLI